MTDDEFASLMIAIIILCAMFGLGLFIGTKLNVEFTDEDFIKLKTPEYSIYLDGCVKYNSPTYCAEKFLNK